ncbi:hypothetical protein GW17_00035428 [Ensete ventricosum]|nr:hypothetical protein GW17_00035428 [Ensete ventricosum]RZR88925.1 hypothetical protein BHM03_00016568 [Ensete ventricosum]
MIEGWSASISVRSDGTSVEFQEEESRVSPRSSLRAARGISFLRCVFPNSCCCVDLCVPKWAVGTGCLNHMGRSTEYTCPFTGKKARGLRGFTCSPHGNSDREVRPRDSQEEVFPQRDPGNKSEPYAPRLASVFVVGFGFLSLLMPNNPRRSSSFLLHPLRCGVLAVRRSSQRRGDEERSNASYVEGGRFGIYVVWSLRSIVSRCWKFRSFGSATVCFWCHLWSLPPALPLLRILLLAVAEEEGFDAICKVWMYRTRDLSMETNIGANA